MEDTITKIKEIISFFIGVDQESITQATVIDKSVVQGSVKVHMMYGNLSDKGFKIDDYSKIKTFGELLSKLNLLTEIDMKNENILSFNNIIPERVSNPSINDFLLETKFIGIGIDILKISKLPRVTDFREAGFYTDNYSSREISYCLLKPDPYKCFGGKFAAKEAIVKANNQFKNVKFNDIEILNDQNGKPQFDKFSISISYEDDFALAIAACEKKSQNENQNANEKDVRDRKIHNELEELMNEFDKNIKSKYLRKSYKGLIVVSLILNIITAFYIVIKVIV